MFRRKAPVIEFTCAPEDKGVIAEPFPAKRHLPGWFKKLPPVNGNAVGLSSGGQTIKRCMPFLDAMSTGWIVPLAATVRINVSEEGNRVEYGWSHDRVMVSNHSSFQIEGHPLQPRPPMKLHNYWTVRTPQGWSCLFVPPLNRPDPNLEILAGVVDTDEYHGFINFPFIFTGKDGLYTLEKGMPLVQVIPYERAGTHIEAVVRAETPAEIAARDRIFRNTQASEGWYRTEARAPRS